MPYRPAGRPISHAAARRAPCARKCMRSVARCVISTPLARRRRRSPCARRRCRRARTHGKADAAGRPRRARGLAARRPRLAQGPAARLRDGLAQTQRRARRGVALRADGAPRRFPHRRTVPSAAAASDTSFATTLDPDAGIGCDQHGDRAAPPAQRPARGRVGKPGGADQQRHAAPRRRRAHAPPPQSPTLKSSATDGVLEAPAREIRGDRRRRSAAPRRPHPAPGAGAARRGDCAAQTKVAMRSRSARSNACPMRPVMPNTARRVPRHLVDRAGEELLDALEEGSARAAGGCPAAATPRTSSAVPSARRSGSPASRPPPGRTGRPPRRRAPAARLFRAPETPARIGSRSESSGPPRRSSVGTSTVPPRAAVVKLIGHLAG